MRRPNESPNSTAARTQGCSGNTPPATLIPLDVFGSHRRFVVVVVVVVD